MAKYAARGCRPQVSGGAWVRPRIDKQPVEPRPIKQHKWGLQDFLDFQEMAAKEKNAINAKHIGE